MDANSQFKPEVIWRTSDEPRGLGQEIRSNGHADDSKIRSTAERRADWQAGERKQAGVKEVMARVSGQRPHSIRYRHIEGIERDGDHHVEADGGNELDHFLLPKHRHSLIKRLL